MDVALESQRIAANVGAHGWHCLHVLPNDEGQDPFSYSIGFAQSFAAPEVLVFGRSRESAHALLAECADLLRGGHMFVPGQEDSEVLSGGYKVVFRHLQAQHHAVYVGTACRYYGARPFSVLVMFLPDRNHLFPWQPGYTGPAASEWLGLV